jgi:hypothetical protein
VRVFAAKLLACISLVFAGAIVLELLLGAALLPAAVFRGATVGEADGAWFASAGLALLRVGVASGLGCALGYAIASIGRNTAASLGAGFVYLAVIESLIRQLRPQWAGWLLGDNLASFLTADQSVIIGRTAMEALAVIAGYVALAQTAALVLHVRRDVT